MKNTLLFRFLFMASAILVSVGVSGQEVVSGGNMENTGYWLTADYPDGAEASPTYTFNYTGDAPTAGAGGCLRIQAVNPGTGGQNVNSLLYQQVTLQAGHTYVFSGAFKDITADSVSNFWCELGLAPSDPSLTAGVTQYMVGINTWDGCGEGLDGTFQDDQCKYTGNPFTIPSEPAGEVIYYLTMLIGNWNSVVDSFNVLVDEFSLIDITLVNSGGNMEDSLLWTSIWRSSAADTGIIDFDYTDDVCTLGNDGALRIASGGQTNACVFQEVTLTPNHIYSLDAAFKNISTDVIANTWVEIIVSRTMPTPPADYGPGAGDYRYQMNTWFAADTLDDYDGMISDRFQFENGLDPHEFVLPDTVTETTWYLVIKAGCWNTAGDPVPSFDLLFDEVWLLDLGIPLNTKLPVENIVYGAVESAEDFTGLVSMNWDADSVYMVFDITDDSIVAEGTSYQVDNIEIYFDMDNSKNVHWPRNGGWMDNDPTFDANDYQLRLVPDSDWTVNNSLEGVNQIYTETAEGYQFRLNIAWDSLLADFDAVIDNVIGFDVLVSDNDAVASDANRNQITWTSLTANAFNDPSIWGELELASDGLFNVILDAEGPTAPANLVAAVDTTSVTVTWDASTDNRTVQYYIISNGNLALDTVLARQTGNTATIIGLEPGDYNIGITAADMYWNKSTRTTTPVTIVGVGLDENLADICKVYPNPSAGIVNVVSTSTLPVSVEIYNIAGGLVLSEMFTGSYRIDLTSNDGGLYLIYLKSNDKVQVQKLILE